MNILYIIFSVFFLLNIYLVKSETANQNTFDNNFKCTVLGSGSVLDGNLTIKTFSRMLINTKLSGASQFNYFRIEKCECYTNSGNCRVATTSQEGSKNLRLIVVFALDSENIDKNNINNNRNVVTQHVTFKTLFQEAQKQNKIKSRSYCNVKNSVYFSSIYSYKNGNKSASIPGYDRPKDIVNSEHRFPLYYTALAQYGKTMDGANGEERLLTVIGTYRIDSVVECVSKDPSFDKVDVRNVYNRSGYFVNTAVDCNWQIN